ncbi:MAG: hypothetical protein QF632_01060 [Candidatus Woesearchaeota archaeon]|jgi:predicted ribosome quality control (RQC) complex YloA/Tae2 family protein|nr:hypothetical protein [Candidatus Woesearchaeota archaeon]MDP7458515.1 hypothetical protein [Candidatus Woesearchaeota archaeon]|tara:strand:- start:121 stop:735 length:615 start_codon:yes stop_codon:yes gene_type:complete
MSWWHKSFEDKIVNPLKELLDKHGVITKKLLDRTLEALEDKEEDGTISTPEAAQLEQKREEIKKLEDSLLHEVDPEIVKVVAALHKVSTTELDFRKELEELLPQVKQLMPDHHDNLDTVMMAIYGAVGHIDKNILERLNGVLEAKALDKKFKELESARQSVYDSRNELARIKEYSEKLKPNLETLKNTAGKILDILSKLEKFTD